MHIYFYIYTIQCQLLQYLMWQHNEVTHPSLSSRASCGRAAGGRNADPACQLPPWQGGRRTTQVFLTALPSRHELRGHHRLKQQVCWLCGDCGAGYDPAQLCVARRACGCCYQDDSGLLRLGSPTEWGSHSWQGGAHRLVWQYCSQKFPF